VLGKDFFLSAALCVVDVAVESPEIAFTSQKQRRKSESVYMRTDGLLSYTIGPKNDKENGKENLRYYSYSGGSEVVPLFHLRSWPMGQRDLHVVSIAETNECSWCRRKFPEGLLWCSLCAESRDHKNIYYCDENCQREAYKIHKARYHKE
jgi:hypothetical protein